MVVSRAKHARVAASLKEFSPEELSSLKDEFETMFAEVELLKLTNMPSQYSKPELEIAIEGFVKIDAAEKGKGWWYRSKLRTNLHMKLL